LAKFSELMRGDELIVAPLALNPIMARLAEDAGFQALYMSGGSLGWLKCVTEANITLPEMAEIALDMRSVCKLPIVLDAGGGWGDPMHVHRTMGLAEAAGFAAIEIEDQLLPRRVEHHIGIDHLIDTDLMVKKIQEAIAARSDPDFVIIARTTARRVYDLDEALRRRRYAVHPHPQRRGTPHRGRAAPRAIDDLRAARRLCGLPLFAGRSRAVGLSAGGFIRHRLCGPA
jgi:2-methylisocitrate lyase-like PEP mutase family enzyme